MKNKKFTILTAAYNSGRYIEDWAKSILAQKYRPLEVIFVEDKSTDNTKEMVKKISKNFYKKNIDFKLIQHNKKLYCGSAYNLALKSATGSYFGILDSDDMLEPFACEFIADIYDRFLNIAWIYTQYNKYNRKMTRVIKKGFCHCPPSNKSILYMEKKGINTYGHWRTFSDRISTLKDLFGEGLKCCVDKHLGIRLEELGIGMFVNKVCYKYRTRSKWEKSIVHSYPLGKIRLQVTQKAKKRRNGKNSYSILRYKNNVN